MRQLAVYKSGVRAGLLQEVASQHYVYKYDDAFLLSSMAPISLTLPKRKEAYHSASLFPFFSNMLPEGVNRRTICRINRIDEQDYFGLLMFFADKDIIGDISLERIEG